MLTGSSSILRSLPVLSSQLPCRLACNQTRFTGGTLPPRSRISTTSHRPQNAVEGRNGPGSHDVSATSSCLPSSSRSIISVNGTPHLARPSIFSGTPTLLADENSVNHPVGTDSRSDTQDHQQHGRMSSIQLPHGASNKPRRKCPAQRRRTLLWVMLTTKSPERAWVAYQDLLSRRAVIPHHSLHQLARLLASVKPRTRAVHLQLLSVLKTLQRNRGQLRLWEWNTLIDSAGKQWHKTRLEDYENAFDIFDKRGVLPTANAGSVDGTLDAKTDSHTTRQDPDIWTYNILLSIAARSNLPLAIRHASSLLRASGFAPNRYTHLCLLRYFATRRDLDGVRSTLRNMQQQGLELGLDGINACLWAYARNGRFDVALRVYRLLRTRVAPAPAPDPGAHDAGEDTCYIHDAVGLNVPEGLAPDEITYTTMIQTLAYHGDLQNALGVFVDMLSTPNRNARVRTNGETRASACYKPSMAAFRALFLGFARHGRAEVERRVEGAEPIAALIPSAGAGWDEDALDSVFAAFLQLPSRPKPTDRIVYWILVAFDKTSRSDVAKLREVWTKLEAKYGGGWGGRLEEFRKSIFASGDPKT